MSTETGDESGPPRGGAGMSEQDARELVERLRSAPAEEVVAELFSTLLSAAQVKLGRRDARLFIDLCAQTLEYARPYLPSGLVAQVEGALGQLRLAQVTAESEVAAKGEPEPHDLSRVPTPPVTGQASSSGAGGPSASPSSKLWVPGR